MSQLKFCEYLTCRFRSQCRLTHTDSNQGSNFCQTCRFRFRSTVGRPTFSFSTELKVFRLKHALYGLKQAELTWWQTLSESMQLMGFKWLSNDAGLYIYKCSTDGQLVVVIIYVDNALFCGKDKKLVAQLKARFMKKWESHNLGNTKEFLQLRRRAKAAAFI